MDASQATRFRYLLSVLLTLAGIGLLVEPSALRDLIGSLTTTPSVSADEQPLPFPLDWFKELPDVADLRELKGIDILALGHLLGILYRHDS